MYSKTSFTNHENSNICSYMYLCLILLYSEANSKADPLWPDKMFGQKGFSFKGVNYKEYVFLGPQAMFGIEGSWV